jgi:hypothetical protein
MENQEVKTKSLGANALLWGLIAGGATILFLLLLYAVDLLLNPFFYYPGLLLPVVFVMIYGSIVWRNKYSEGYLGYGKSFLSCLITGLVSSFIVMLFFYVLYEFIAPELIEKSIELQAKFMENRVSEEEILKQGEKTREAFANKTYLIGLVIVNAIKYPLLSLIAALFVRKEEKLIV